MPAAARRLRKTTAFLVVAIAAMFAATEYAEARRGGMGGFGSRGSKTYSAPPTTQTAPERAAPVQRSMTPQPAQTQRAAPGAAGQTANAQRPGLFGGFGGALLGGLMLGGLVGMLFGGGLGGFAGFLGLILQVGLILLLVSLAMRFFRSRQQPATAGPNPFERSPHHPEPNRSAPQATPFSFGGAGSRGSGSGGSASRTFAQPAPQPYEATAEDLDRFEVMLAEVQDAYSREDYAALRQLATPEAMSYLAEELGELASAGKKNVVSDVKLLQGDVAEAWHEDGKDYVTVAMRYSAVDYIAKRDSGEALSGDPDGPAESTEVWTFVRSAGGEWLLSAIQGTE
ncbi:membrane protein [Roseibium aquae]|uniref:Membrane protein n=1 Tax=Roseibium aquae TaxID=1323746 RepID=A0A916TBA2_9HYPH|nr:TIM44-like domain-containing protein [Roseibium aquae]GGB35971.1 membrane protein [Roseibium aquae]